MSDPSLANSEKWVRRFMALAQHVAQWSKDPSTKVGAVVLSGKEHGRIAIGYNGFPPGIADTPNRLEDKETKYRLIQHAERNVLDNASFSLAGASLFTTMFPCHECAKSIISRGIEMVVCPPPPDREPWSTSSRWTREMFTEAGVHLLEVDPAELAE